jgi:HD superfamily phosphohydrolase
MVTSVAWCDGALLHDIGHGPFSHVSENALDRFGDRKLLTPGQKQDKIHEVVTAHLIRNHPDVRRILGQDDCERVAQLLSSGYGEPVLRAIISGPAAAFPGVREKQPLPGTDGPRRRHPRG